MKFSIEQDNDVAVFALKEERLDSTNSAELKKEFLIIAQTDINVLIADLSSVSFCDSTGLSALLLAERQFRERDGGVMVVDPHGKVKTLLEIAKLTDIIPVFQSVDEARGALID